MPRSKAQLQAQAVQIPYPARKQVPPTARARELLLLFARCARNGLAERAFPSTAEKPEPCFRGSHFGRLASADPPSTHHRARPRRSASYPVRTVRSSAHPAQQFGSSAMVWARAPNAGRHRARLYRVRTIRCVSRVRPLSGPCPRRAPQTLSLIHISFRAVSSP